MTLRNITDFNQNDFYLNTGLYESVIIDNPEKAVTLLGSSLNIDCFCTECRKDSTYVANEMPDFKNYQINKVSVLQSRETAEDRFLRTNLCIERSLFCSRDNTHMLHFVFVVSKSSVTKIGQYPSIADLDYGYIRKYRKVLDKDYSEFSKAIGLYANGVGIGSYVYLRRIIERLIEEAHIKKLKTSEWNEEIYCRSKFGEKIDLVSDALDTDAVSVLKPLYSILSKGVHELSEEECIKHFDELKYAIEYILDDKLAILERENKRKEIASKINNIQSTIK